MVWFCFFNKSFSYCVHRNIPVLARVRETMWCHQHFENSCSNWQARWDDFYMPSSFFFLWASKRHFHEEVSLISAGAIWRQICWSANVLAIKGRKETAPSFDAVLPFLTLEQPTTLPLLLMVCLLPTPKTRSRLLLTVEGNHWLSKTVIKATFRYLHAKHTNTHKNGVESLINMPIS